MQGKVTNIYIPLIGYTNSDYGSTWDEYTGPDYKQKNINALVEKKWELYQNGKGFKVYSKENRRLKIDDFGYYEMYHTDNIIYKYTGNIVPDDITPFL